MARAKPDIFPDTFLEFWEQIGEVPLERVRMNPLPGTATEKDVIAALEAPRKRICELIDGVLVEKAVGAREANLAVWIGYYLCAFLEEHNLGIPYGPDGTLRILPKQVRIPDVCFVSWDRIPGDEVPEEAIPDLVPNLAVEVLSAGNTKREMERKLRDYFTAGVELVWFIYPRKQYAEAYTSPEDKRRVGKTGVLEGGSVLPGFSLSLAQLFSRGRKKPRPGS